MDKSLSPSFVRITYTGATGVHHAIVPVNIEPGWVQGIEPNFLLKDGSSEAAETAITEYVDAWKTGLSNTQQIGLCEIYAVDADTGEGTFVYGFDLATTGINPIASKPYLGASLTFKLINGKTGRTLWMENPFLTDYQVYPPFDPDVAEGIFAEYMIGTTSMFYGRGNAYPFAAIRLVTKEYDALRKRGGL